MPAPHAIYSKMLAERTDSRNVLVLFYFILSRGYEVGAREEHEEGASREPKRRGKTERTMERMGHDTSQPATGAVRGT